MCREEWVDAGILVAKSLGRGDLAGALFARISFVARVPRMGRCAVVCARRRFFSTATCCVEAAGSFFAPRFACSLANITHLSRPLANTADLSASSRYPLVSVFVAERESVFVCGWSGRTADQGDLCGKVDLSVTFFSKPDKRPEERTFAPISAERAPCFIGATGGRKRSPFGAFAREWRGASSILGNCELFATNGHFAASRQVCGSAPDHVFDAAQDIATRTSRTPTTP